MDGDVYVNHRSAGAPFGLAPVRSVAPPRSPRPKAVLPPKADCDPRRRYYVYALHLEDGTPFYVGKGCGNRCYQHLRPKADDLSLKSQIIRRMMAAGTPPRIVKFRENMTEHQALVLEAKKIRSIGRKPYGPLVNLRDAGGRGMPQGIMNPVERAWVLEVRRLDEEARQAEKIQLAEERAIAAAEKARAAEARLRRRETKLAAAATRKRRPSTPIREL